MTHFDKFVQFLLSWEGGFVNDPDDQGGATNMGVTLNTYKAYCKKKARKEPTIEDIKVLDKETFKSILIEYYWNRCKANDIKSNAVAFFIVDSMWHSGHRIIKEYQRSLSLQADGIVGKETIKALNLFNSNVLLEKLREIRLNYLDRIALKGNNKKYLSGWKRRVNSIHLDRLITNDNKQIKI